MDQAPLAARVWRRLEQLLAEERSPYLHRDKFVLQRDAFVRLSDEDVESDVPFLSYEYNQVTSDEALDFSLWFFESGFLINIGPTTLDYRYEAYSLSATAALALTEQSELPEADPAVIAANLLLTVKLLLGGQLALGCSWNNGQLMAAETFLLGYGRKPVSAAISANFSLLHRTAHDYTTRQNHILPGHVDVPDSFPLLPPVVKGERVAYGRRVETIHDLPPLTKKSFNRVRKIVALSGVALSRSYK